MNWVLLSFGALILNTIATLLIRKIGKRMNPHLMTTYLFSTLAILLIFTNIFFLKESFVIPNAMILPLVFMGFIGSIVYLLLYKSITVSPNPGYPSAIFASNTVIVALISAFILGTSLTTLKFIGMIIAISGTIILTLSK